MGLLYYCRPTGYTPLLISPQATMVKVRKYLTSYISLGLNQILTLMGCDSHLSQQQILRLSCPLHHLENLPASSAYDNKEIPRIQVKIRNDRQTLYIAPPNQVVPCRIFHCLDFFSSRALLLPEINRTVQTFSPYTVYTINSVISWLGGGNLF